MLCWQTRITIACSRVHAAQGGSRPGVNRPGLPVLLSARGVR